MGMKFLITGANGFVGKLLGAKLLQRGYFVRAAMRSADKFADDLEPVMVGDIDGATDWSEALHGVEVVVHLAARVHVMREIDADPLAEFRRVNVDGTANLARQAAGAGVKRLVYVSSVKVNGESTTPILTPAPPLKGRVQNAFTEADAPCPQDPYGISKWEAEQALHRVAQETGLEVVIVRPPLVYGPGAKGNFISLLKAVGKGIPLPLAATDNARSLIYVGNLADALAACAIHPAAAGQTYLVSDGAPVSTAALVAKIAQALGCRNRAFRFPPVILRSVAALLGRTAQVDRLLGSLRVNDAKIRSELGWTPPFTLEQGLQATAMWYRGTEHCACK